MPSLPTPFRAALGIVATVLDGAKDFPDKAIELPMLAVSSALQVSLRAQQRYAALCAKGDDLLAGRRTTDEPPPWATFDEPLVPVDPIGSEDPIEPMKTVRRPRGAAPSRFDEVGE